MMKRLKRWWWRNGEPVVKTYWWIPSAKYEELPPLSTDPRFEMRINHHNISEYRVPKAIG